MLLFKLRSRHAASMRWQADTVCIIDWLSSSVEIVRVLFFQKITVHSSVCHSFKISCILLDSETVMGMKFFPLFATTSQLHLFPLETDSTNFFILWFLFYLILKISKKASASRTILQFLRCNFRPHVLPFMSPMVQLCDLLGLMVDLLDRFQTFHHLHHRPLS